VTAAPDVSLPQFEGPLDLLLDLVRKNEIDIADIPIAEITRQYLDYLGQAERLDIDLGAEFTYIAALLIHIKSRSLLASDTEIPGRREDPRQELVDLLVEHDRARRGAEFLKQKLELAQATWSKPPSPEFPAPFAELPATTTFNLLEVLRLAKQALETAQAYDAVFPSESVTVEEMARWLAERIAEGPGERSADVFLRQQPTLERQSALFLAMLDLAKDGRIHLEQTQCFGPITLRFGTTVP
jgi:segregation and condensation protein A